MRGGGGGGGGGGGARATAAPAAALHEPTIDSASIAAHAASMALVAKLELFSAPEEVCWRPLSSWHVMSYQRLRHGEARAFSPRPTRCDGVVVRHGMA